jgi:hypothetical protein
MPRCWASHQKESLPIKMIPLCEAGVSLQDVSLHGVYLHGVYLQGVNLHGVYQHGVYLHVGIHLGSSSTVLSNWPPTPMVFYKGRYIKNRGIYLRLSDLPSRGRSGTYQDD